MTDFQAAFDPESGNIHLTVTGTIRGVNHSFHAVASDERRKGEFYCMDCSTWFPKEQYASPYKDHSTPYMIWHDVE